MALALAAADPARAAPPADAVDQAFHRIYSLDFDGAHAILDELIQNRPADPLPYAVRGAAHLFAEFHRLRILETEFFADNEKVTARGRLKPDAAARARLLQATKEAKQRAAARLAADPQDREALFARSMAFGLETQYAVLVEKSYLRGYSLSKEGQRYARQLVALQPPVYDAYLTLGAVEYVVANLNFIFRLFIRFQDIEGSRLKAIEHLQKVVEGGRFYPPFARILLAVIYLREKQPYRALELLAEVQREFPENQLVRNEILRISEKLARAEGVGGRPR